MEGASNLCGKTWQVLVRELVGKNAKEAICVGFPHFAVLRGSSRPSAGTKGAPIPAVLGGVNMVINKTS